MILKIRNKEGIDYWRVIAVVSNLKAKTSKQVLIVKV